MTFTTDPYQKDVRPNIGHQAAVSRLYLFPFNFYFEVVTDSQEVVRLVERCPVTISPASPRR